MRGEHEVSRRQFLAAGLLVQPSLIIPLQRRQEKGAITAFEGTFDIVLASVKGGKP